MPPTPGEDADLMFYRGQLESYWRNHLFEWQRAEWRAYWTNHDTLDVAGRRYVNRPAQTLAEVEVEEPTRFAWDKIYAVARFNQEITGDISTHPPFPCEIANAEAAADRVYIDFQNPSPWFNTFRWILWATPAYDPTTTDPRYILRPISFFTWTDAPVVCDVTADYLARFDSIGAGTIAFRAATILDAEMINYWTEILAVETS